MDETRVGRAVGAAVALYGSLVCNALAGPVPPSNTGNFVVTSARGSAMTVYDRDGRWIDRLRSDELSAPSGVVIGHDGRVFIANEATQEVLAFEGDECVQVFSDPQLLSPQGLAMIGDTLWVCSSGNDRLLGFGLDGSLRAVASGGGLRSPRSVTADWGSLYVTTPGSQFIYRFDGGGRFIKRFTGGGLLAPGGITRSAGNRLYVSDPRRSKVLIFSTGGDELDEIAHRDLAGAGPLAFDDRGHLFVATPGSILELNRQGERVRRITAGRMSADGGIAFAATPYADVDDDGAVTVIDFSIAAANWGRCSGQCEGDVNRSGAVDLDDLFILIRRID